jgi:ATP-dependent DNA helicase RecQ
VRLELARTQGVPAYVVLGDAGLAALARDMPRDEAGLLRVPGIGKVKVERYGAALLTALADAADEADSADGTDA